MAAVPPRGASSSGQLFATMPPARGVDAVQNDRRVLPRVLAKNRGNRLGQRCDYLLVELFVLEPLGEKRSFDVSHEALSFCYGYLMQRSAGRALYVAYSDPARAGRAFGRPEIEDVSLDDDGIADTSGLE